MYAGCMVVFNLFFVPMISMLILYKRNGYPYQVNLQFFMRYAACAVWVLVLTYAVSLVSKGIFNYSLRLVTEDYTLGGVVMAVLVPYLQALLKKWFQVKCEIEKDEEK